MNLAISLPVESFTNNTAPAIASFVSLSTLVMLTTTFFGAFSKLTLISLFVSDIVKVYTLLFTK